MGKALDVVIFSRDGCHLCEQVEDEIRSMEGVVGNLTVIDIDGDISLQAKYLTRIPVVAVGGREVFEAKMMGADGAWKSELAGALARPSGSAEPV